eukprot:UN3907
MEAVETPGSASAKGTQLRQFIRTSLSSERPCVGTGRHDCTGRQITTYSLWNAKIRWQGHHKCAHARMRARKHACTHPTPLWPRLGKAECLAPPGKAAATVHSVSLAGLDWMPWQAHRSMQATFNAPATTQARTHACMHACMPALCLF